MGEVILLKNQEDKVEKPEAEGIQEVFDIFLEALLGQDPADIAPSLAFLLLESLDISKDEAVTLAVALCEKHIILDDAEYGTHIIKRARPNNTQAGELALRTVAFIATSPDLGIPPEGLGDLSEMAIRFAGSGLWTDDKEAAPQGDGGPEEARNVMATRYLTALREAVANNVDAMVDLTPPSEIVPYEAGVAYCRQYTVSIARRYARV